MTKVLRANIKQVLFVVLAFAAMVLVSTVYVSDIVRDQMLLIGEETMNTTQTAVSATLSESELIFANMTQAVQTMLDAGESNAAILQYLTRTNSFYRNARSPMPDFMKTYGYIRGEFLDGSGWIPHADYEPVTRPWHIGALEAGEAIYFSEPYIDADTGGMCISFSQQMFDRQGVSQGVIAIDLNLTRITQYVSGQQIVDNGYGVLLSDTMHITTHRLDEVIGLTMAELGGAYARVSERLEAGEAISAYRLTDLDGTDSVAFFRTIFNGWHIGIIIPRASYYSQLNSMVSTLVVLGVLLMTALSYLLLRSQAAKMRSDEENQSKSGFLARMSHEMRTPMNAVIGMTNIAKKAEDMEKVSYCLDKIDEAANHLLGVINDILDMSKIEAGKMELSESVFALESVVEQVKTVTGFKMEEKHQRFTVRVAEDVPPVIIADRQWLAQVITNLLSNATKFTPEGGNIGLTIQRLEDAGDKCTLRIDVTDDGIGISKEQQARLFQSFEQADGGISRKYGGTGLGLAISKRIISMMGGDAWIESELGKGSNFIFTITAGVGSPDMLPSLPHEAADHGGSFAGKRILLAEDVEINREIVMAMLEDTGVRVDCAENGAVAVGMFREAAEGYDMIFMDIHMPEVDGLEATRQIRRMARQDAGTVPIIAMTANVFREDIEKCLEAGMNAHLGKPLNHEEVLEVMGRYMT